MPKETDRRQLRPAPDVLEEERVTDGLRTELYGHHILMCEIRG